MSFVERSIILCPYLGGSTIGGSTVIILQLGLMFIIISILIVCMETMITNDPLTHTNELVHVHTCTYMSLSYCTLYNCCNYLLYTCTSHVFFSVYTCSV